MDQLTKKSLTSGLQRYLGLNKPLTLKKAINGTQISKLRRENPEQLVKTLFAGLWSLVKTVDANKTMNQGETQECVEVILIDYHWMKLEEIFYVFQKIRRGDYGKLYERLKMPEILNAICEYDLDERERYVIKANAKHKEVEKEPIISNDIPAAEMYENYLEAKEKEANKPKEKDEDFATFRTRYLTEQAQKNLPKEVKKGRGNVKKTREGEKQNA